MIPIRKKCVWISALLCLAVGFSPASAQDDDPGWQDLVKDVVQEALEGSGDGEVGQIRRVKFTPRGGGRVDLSVELRGVDDPGRVGFEVEIWDDKLRPIEPLDVTWDEVPAGEGRTVVHVAYLGDGKVKSVGGNVNLVDRDTGGLSSRRKVALPWEWEGDGSGAAPSSYGGGGSHSASAGELSTRDEGVGVVEREPVIVSLDPVRIGDTPKPGEIRIATVQSAKTPTPRQEMHTATISPALATGIRMASFTVDLYDMASKAKWSSNRGTLPFNGSNNDNRGFVRQLGTATMIDGKRYKDVLQTHPAWVDNGTIKGVYALTIPTSASRFEAKVGFLKGVTRSDGVEIDVQLTQGSRGTSILRKKVVPKAGVVAVTGTIPQSLRGQRVNMTLLVTATGTSTQDWFAWIGPVVK